MKCDNCNSMNTYIKDYNHTYTIKGKTVKFTSKRRFCKECNELVYDSELDNEAGRKAIEKYNKECGIPKEKIIELRNRYHLSQEQFSKIIGCAKKTLISYEKGTSIPNDNYLITLKSLLNMPNYINVLVESNKNNFSKKEYEKIESRIMSFLSDNTFKINLNINNFEENELTEFNGYTKKSNDKIKNMILFFSKEGVLKTKLMKEMFYADFYHYKMTASSITGLKYAKIDYGPVPDNKDIILAKCMLDKLIKEEIDYKNDYEYHVIIALEEYDKKVFDDKELESMKKIKEYFKNFKSKEIANFSHEEKAYIETDFSKNISYDYAFDINRIN